MLCCLAILLLNRNILAQQSHFQLKGLPCEGCEAVFEYGKKKLTSIDTLPDFNRPGPKLVLKGKVFKRDGRTPAAGVILYIYHTNQDGKYTPMGNAKGWGRRHGEIRGWVKTDNNGSYTFYTLKPGTYPSRSEPAHIHATVLEPNGKYYYLEEWYFADDPLLYKLKSQKRSMHGGEGIVTPVKVGTHFLGTRDIVLGLNIKDYD